MSSWGNVKMKKLGKSMEGTTVSVISQRRERYLLGRTTDRERRVHSLPPFLYIFL